MDLELFYNLLHVLKERGFLGETIEARNGNRATIKNNILISINANDFVNAKYWIKYGKDKEWFNKEEIELHKNLNDNEKEYVMFHELAHFFAHYYRLENTEMFADAFAKYVISVIKQLGYVKK